MAKTLTHGSCLRWAFACIAIATLFSGCSISKDPTVELLEGELRWMEDQLYMMEDQLSQTCRSLQQCRTKAQTTGPAPTEMPSPGGLPGHFSRGTPQTEKSAPSQPNSTGDVATPSIELPEMPVVELPQHAGPIGTPVEPAADDWVTTPAAELPQEVVEEVFEPNLIAPDSITHEVILSDEVVTPADSYPGDSYPADAIPMDSTVETTPADDRDDSYGQIEPTPAERPEPTAARPEDNVAPSPDSSIEQLPESINEEGMELPAPGDRPEIDTLKATSQDKFSIRLQSHVESIEPVEPAPTRLDPHVTHIVIGSQMYGPGDTTELRVVIEPRNAAGDYLEIPGRTSLVVLDADRTGSAARIARWDFTPADLRGKNRTSELGTGYHLDLQWPESAPTGENLHLFVRYFNVEGRKIENDQPLEQVFVATDERDAEGWSVLGENPDGQRGWQTVTPKTTESDSTVYSNESANATNGTNSWKVAAPKRSAASSSEPGRLADPTQAAEPILQPIPMKSARTVNRDLNVQTIAAEVPLQPRKKSAPVAPARFQTVTETPVATPAPTATPTTLPTIHAPLQRPQWKPYR